jgi:hypothetical protein
MNISRRTIFFLVFSISFNGLFAQSIKMDKKALSFLSSEKTVNVIFAYNEILFNSDELSEAAFLKHIDQKITDHADSSMANEWLTDFQYAKATQWPRVFISQLNTYLGKLKHAPAFVLNAPETKYTMVIHTFWMDFGYDFGLMKRPAKADMKIYFYKSSDPLNAITSSKNYRAEGMINESRYKNEEYPKPSLASMQDMYVRTATHLYSNLKKALKQ